MRCSVNTSASLRLWSQAGQWHQFPGQCTDGVLFYQPVSAGRYHDRIEHNEAGPVCTKAGGYGLDYFHIINHTYFNSIRTDIFHYGFYLATHIYRWYGMYGTYSQSVLYGDCSNGPRRRLSSGQPVYRLLRCNRSLLYLIHKDISSYKSHFDKVFAKITNNLVLNVCTSEGNQLFLLNIK